MREFEFRKVEFEDKEFMAKLYHLRFKVYCHERRFFNSEDYPTEVEFDEYDGQSIHFAAVDKEDGEIVGTLRMILPGRYRLPIEKYCPHIKVNDDIQTGKKFGEISRLVITKELRRRKHDGHYYGFQAKDIIDVDANNREFRRSAKPMTFGLYREMYWECKKIGVTHWYTLMEKSLWRLLHKHGLLFECIGDEVDCCGPVKPYLASIVDIEKELNERFPEFFEYFGMESYYKP